MKAGTKTDIATALLPWYDRHARRLPWRVLPGQRPDPYHVWLSEIMLQQTTVTTVAGYFGRFLARWPTVEDLTAAELDAVLTEWAGLGYYARARNLHKCARIVAGELNGQFPADEARLRALPGIGRYTAAAVAAIAFDRPVAVMDGNIERVTSRLFAVDIPLPEAKPTLFERVKAMTPNRRPGDFAQAMMDLGATICTSGRPKCMLCPLQLLCEGQELAETLPRKRLKKAKPTRRGTAFWIERADGSVLLRKRPERGLLGGMMEFPSTPWDEAGGGGIADAGLPDFAAHFTAVGAVRHTFTHFHLELQVCRGRVVDDAVPAGCKWQRPEALGEEALPTLMRKVAKAALSAGETDL